MIAGLLKINRKRIYYKRLIPEKDLKFKGEINKIHIIHPAYGHRRVALELGISRNKTLRIMKKFGIKPPRRKAKGYFLTRSTSSHHYTNLIKNIIPAKPNEIYVTDLTYLKYQGKFIYLGSVEDIFTREILGADISDKHDSSLALKAIQNAINKGVPEYFHFDQGSEFLAQIVTSYIESRKIKISVSDKGSPWQNGYKESFFGRFKDENGDLNRFGTLGELIEEIYSYIYYYNNLRIHTALKMPPAKFKKLYVDSVSQKRGT